MRIMFAERFGCIKRRAKFQRLKNGNESLDDEEHGSRPQVVETFFSLKKTK